MSRLNIVATGFPINYALDKLIPNNPFILADHSTQFNYLTAVRKSIADVHEL